MGTHPIFESDFDCLTELIRNRIYEKKRTVDEKSKNLKTKNQK